MSTEQDAVITVVKKWCTIEHNIKRLSKELKELRQEKKELSENLVGVMKKNDVDCFDITGGKILYTQNNVKGAINREHLTTALSQLFTKSGASQDDIKATVDHIMNSRKVTVKDNIRLKNINKS
jgi:hypothetical protein